MTKREISSCSILLGFQEQLTQLQEQFTVFAQQRPWAGSIAERINRTLRRLLLLAREILLQQTKEVKLHSESTAFLFEHLSCFLRFLQKQDILEQNRLRVWR